jgi:hypothetical protein
MVHQGALYRDKITGFKGIVTARVQYITGCDQALVVPPVGKDGKMGEGQWIDESRLDRVGTSQVVLRNIELRITETAAPIGFDKEPPKR